MVGGGNYAVLGVVTGIAGATTLSRSSWPAGVAVELLYFERDVLAEGIARFEPVDAPD